MKRKIKQKKYLLFGGLIMIALAVLLTALLFSLQFDELWQWYASFSQKLIELEEYIIHIDIKWQFFVAVMLLFIVKSFFPIYATSTICFISGMVLPSYFSIPVNIIGFIVLITIRYFWGKRFGAGSAWWVIRKNRKMRKLIQQDGNGNPVLLIALRLIPGMPVNSISGIYGSFDFGYVRFLFLSVVGFLPKIISFTFVGRNVYDPLSAGFLLPLIIILFLTGLSLLSVNGMWATVEKLVKYSKNHKNRQISEERDS